MANENGLAVFSLRLPQNLADQIDVRAQLSRRSRTSEIIMLLETAIDLHVSRDLKILDEHRQKDPTLVTLGNSN